jgi:hypothetical protein
MIVDSPVPGVPFDAAVPASESVIVAQITGMADCKWSTVGGQRSESTGQPKKNTITFYLPYER